MDLTIRIGGEAGQGLQLIGGVLAKLFARSGLHVFSHQDYMSRIRGGHNYYQLRISVDPVAASRDAVDILLALDADTVKFHCGDLAAGGIILCDAESLHMDSSSGEFVSVPFAGITVEKKIRPIMANSVAVGAVLGILDLDLGLVEGVIRDFVGRKGEVAVRDNVTAVEAGRDHIRKHHEKLNGLKIKKLEGQGHLLISGSRAIGLGALLGGCRFYSGYPMSPSTGIMNYLASRAEKYNIVVEQAEDELAAINMALGASYGGVRAMTGTSGGGFALMAEGFSLAGITETPVVIAEMQRPGPATGMPTRTEQADLFFVIYGGHGEFPRVVFAPGTPEQAMRLTCRAFHLAEKYQIPVIVMGDQYLADSEWTYEKLDTEDLAYEDFRLRAPELDKLENYSRYADTESGISPLAVPGESKYTVVVDSHEHDETGHISEDAEIRSLMVRKRLAKKAPLIRAEIEPPAYYGSHEPETVLVCCGSTFGVVREAVDRRADRCRIGMLHFSEVFPFPNTEKFDYLELLEKAAMTICIENNFTGQFARLLHSETGFAVARKINRYDGRPFSLESLLGELDEHI